MSDHVSKACLDEEATSRTSSQACQPSWMSQWTRKNSEVASRVNESSLVCNKDKFVNLGGKSDASPSTLNMANGFSKYGKGVIKDSKEMLFGMTVETKKQGYLKCETNDHEFETKNLSLALALGRGQTSTELNLGNQTILRFNEKHCVSNPFEERKGLAFGLPPHGSKKADTSRPVVVFEKHFSNDNFTCFGKESCKYQKYSSLLLHETDMKNDLSYEMGQNLQHGQSENKNFQAFFGKKQSVSVPSHHCVRLLPTYPSQSNIDSGKSRLLDNVSVHNVETMRICTMVDCVENSSGGYHKISQRAHHVLFTKETCANLPAHGVAATRPCGVKIQPLWTSIDSEEKENTGNSSVFKAGSKNEASVETDSMQETAPRSLPNLSGRTSSPLRKDNKVDENSSLAACDSKTGKTRTKRPLLEIPDMNIELPGLQPAVSSTDDEPSSSRVHSLNAKHLFSNKKRGSRNEGHSLSPEASNKCLEPGNRWIKRLKLSSSDSVGVGTKSSDGKDSSRQKFNMFFNRIMKCNKESLDPELLKQLDQEQKEPEQDLKSAVSKKIDHSVMNGCSWIQRWCQNSTVSRPKNPEPIVICEPHSLKFGQDELAKKQFPSIGALALMGKAMNGYRSCEFSKRGSVVVWNTREF